MRTVRRIPPYRAGSNRIQRNQKVNFNNASGAGVGTGRLKSTQRTLVLKVSLIDGGTTPGKVILFGTLDDAENKDFNVTNNTQVQGSPESYNRMIERIKQKESYFIAKAKLFAVNDEQGSNAIIIKDTEGAGSGSFESYLPEASTSSLDNAPFRYDLNDLSFDLKQGTSIEFDVAKSIGTGVVILTLVIGSRINVDNAIAGQPVIDTNSLPTADTLKLGV